MSGFPAPAEVLPHRPPFLFLDDVVELEAGATAKGTWTLTGDEAFFAGHFPGRPTLPGVLMVEAIAQLGAYTLLSHERFRDKLPLFGGVDSARFRRQGLPGDLLEIEIQLGRISARAGKGAGTVTIEGQMACQADMFFVMVDATA